MLPLSNSSTLRLLGISLADLQHLCSACTGFIRYVLDTCQDSPQRLGLPPRAPAPSQAQQPQQQAAPAQPAGDA